MIEQLLIFIKLDGKNSTDKFKKDINSDNKDI